MPTTASRLFLTALTILFLTAPLGAAIVPATIVAMEDDPIGVGDTISNVNQPFTNGLGHVGFTGGTNGGDNYVWFDDGPAWLNSNGVGLSGAEASMGIGNLDDTFLYSPAQTGSIDSVWTHDGLLLAEENPAPDAPGEFISFNSRPQMLPSGTAYWIAGLTDTIGGGTLRRALYKATNTVTPVISLVLAGGDMVGGFTIGQGSGVDFDYAISDDDSHHIQALVMTTGSTADDGFLYVDGTLVARESEPSGDGDNWDNFDAMSINDGGNYVFSGDTDGDTTSDEFIAYNAMIVVREGDMVDDVELTTAASVRALSLNNNDEAVHAWSISGGTEYVFFATDASDLAATSRRVLATGDELDLDGDGMGETTVTDINSSTIAGPGLSLAEDGFLYIELGLDDGGGEKEAIVRLSLVDPTIFADGFESGDTTAWTATVP